MPSSFTHKRFTTPPTWHPFSDQSRPFPSLARDNGFHSTGAGFPPELGGPLPLTFSPRRAARYRPLRCHLTTSVTVPRSPFFLPTHAVPPFSLLIACLCQSLAHARRRSFCVDNIGIPFSTASLDDCGETLRHSSVFAEGHQRSPPLFLFKPVTEVL